MGGNRLKHIPGFSIDRVAAAVGDDPEVLRLENLDTDLRPPEAALAATRAAVERDEFNSYLPFTGHADLREAVAQRLSRQTGLDHSPDQVVITCGGTEGIFDVLLALTDPGDEVVLTDSIYAGMINRVRLAGAIPKLVPYYVNNGEWRLDIDALKDAVTERTAALLMMSPSMPCGAVMNRDEWRAVVDICTRRSIWLINNAAMERILFDRREYIHPGSLPEMIERTVTVGSVSKEFCMIGWRVGWVVGPACIMDDIARAHIYNVVTPAGIAQAGAIAALQTSESDLNWKVLEWQRRRDCVMDEMRGLPAVTSGGGWSLLVDVGAMGHDSFTASRLLLEKGRIAATPMRDWGERNSDQFVRFVYSNEPVSRLKGLRERVLRALG